MCRLRSASSTPRSVVIRMWRSTNSQFVRLAEASVIAPPDEVCDVTALFQCSVESAVTLARPRRLKAACPVGSLLGGDAPGVTLVVLYPPLAVSQSWTDTAEPVTPGLLAPGPELAVALAETAPILTRPEKPS